MFRDIVRIKQKMSEEECVSLLRGTVRGVLSVLGDDGYPYGMPHNHFYNEEDGMLYFHSGMHGHKIDALRRCDKVSYCVMDEGVRKDGDWPLYFQSVIVFGRVEFIEDRETVYEISEKLSLQFTDDREYIADEIARVGKRTALFRIRPEFMTGKRVKES